MKRALFILEVLVIAVFLLASVFYWYQGGFGAGHKRYDFIVGMNALPWPEAVFGMLPSPLWDMGDYVPIVLFPALINSGVICLLYLVIRKRQRK